MRSPLAGGPWCVGIHPFADPALADPFDRVAVPFDASEAHEYSVEWLPDAVSFYVDGRLVKISLQSPAYPMQFMLGLYAFDERATPRATTQWFRGWQLPEHCYSGRTCGSIPGMKLSVSLSEDDVRFLDRYVIERKVPSRSAVLQRAIRALRVRELAAEYEEAWEEWFGSEDAKLWDRTTSDGLE